jgi:hypothetical protein
VIRAADTLAEATSRLKASPQFHQWGRLRPEEAHILVEEKHFTPQALAEAWGVSTETIRQIFREEPGVLKIGKPGTRSKRGYFTLRIPQEVAERVHRRLSA